MELTKDCVQWQGLILLVLMQNEELADCCSLRCQESGLVFQHSQVIFTATWSVCLLSSVRVPSSNPFSDYLEIS
jgi:hypothetical protein